MWKITQTPRASNRQAAPTVRPRYLIAWTRRPEPRPRSTRARVTLSQLRTLAGDRRPPAPHLPHSRGERGLHVLTRAPALGPAKSSSSTRQPPRQPAHRYRSHHRTRDTTRPTSQGSIGERPALGIRIFPPQPHGPVPSVAESGGDVASPARTGARDPSGSAAPAVSSTVPG